MTEILNVKSCGLQFSVGYVKKKIVGALDGHQIRITEYWLLMYMYIRQYRNISYDIGKITI